MFEVCGNKFPLGTNFCGFLSVKQRDVKKEGNCDIFYFIITFSVKKTVFTSQTLQSTTSRSYNKAFPVILQQNISIQAVKVDYEAADKMQNKNTIYNNTSGLKAIFDYLNGTKF